MSLPAAICGHPVHICGHPVHMVHMDTWLRWPYVDTRCADRLACNFDEPERDEIRYAFEARAERAPRGVSTHACAKGVLAAFEPRGPEARA